ncbi:MAG: CDP-alcohol phosphatidyltransferase family protein [Deltaproteobacteria bacterium]|uniref:CDP-alcohol phosphatidyltransferase family protein n=1 Tax=Candidatus Zymogenus saltonus TaxID=2844893 RepID=A0A9D8KEN1_9DELT|nr:CDP-alcohol phosphatidyltransferase family protein [Candidatus Zymogenus saltonus]
MSKDTSLKQNSNFLLIQLVTFARVPITIGVSFILIYTTRSVFVIFLCAALLGIAELSDIFDGMFARKLEVVSEWGSMFDPFADSISRLIIYWTFAVIGFVLPFVPLSMAIRDIIVAYSRIILAQRGKSVSAKLSGKIKAIVQGTGTIIIIIGPLYWGFIGKWTVYALSWIVIVVTLASAVEYAYSAINVLSKEGVRPK